MPFSRLFSSLTSRNPASEPNSPSCSLPDCNVCKNMFVVTGDKDWAEHSKSLSMPPCLPDPTTLPASDPNLKPVTNPVPEIRPGSSVYSQPTIALTALADSNPEDRAQRPLWIPAFDITILILSTATLTLASVYGHQLLHAPLSSNYLRHSSTELDPTLGQPNSSQSQSQSSPDTNAVIWTVLYSGSMPLLSLLSAILSMLLWYTGKITATYTAIDAVSFMAGWMVNLAWWVECDWASSDVYMPKDYGVCYQTRLILESRGGLVGVDSGLMRAKIAFAVLVCVSYLAYFLVSVWKIGRVAPRVAPRIARDVKC